VIGEIVENLVDGVGRPAVLNAVAAVHGKRVRFKKN